MVFTQKERVSTFGLAVASVGDAACLLEGTATERDDLILVSVDDHIIEPPDIFVNHLPKRYQDEAPRLVHREDGSDVWPSGTTPWETPP
jgi:hypothetical protein